MHLWTSSTKQTESATKTEVKTQVLLKYVDRIVYRDRVVIKTVTKPDGTKIVTKTEDKTNSKTDTKVDSTVATKKDSIAAPVETKLPAYLVGISYPLTSFSHPDQAEVLVGARLGNLPLYLVGTSQPLHLTLEVGLVYQW